MVGRAGFEPTKAEPTDLQSAPFDRFGISPKNKRSNYLQLFIYFSKDQCFRTHYLLKSRWTDSNRRPADYKSAALAS